MLELHNKIKYLKRAEPFFESSNVIRVTGVLGINWGA
jgi:hypothetical protein